LARRRIDNIGIDVFSCRKRGAIYLDCQVKLAICRAANIGEDVRD